MRVLSVASARRGALALAAAFALAGCGTASSTLEVIPPPMSTATVIALPSSTGSATTATEAPVASPTDAPSPTATPEATQSQTATTPTSTPSAAASPTSAAAACTGNDTNKAFFAEAASLEPFDVYCAVLASSWWVQSGQYTLPNGGEVTVSYTNTAGALISIGQGSICPPPKVCASFGSNIGSASFGGLGATLYLVDSTPRWMVVVGPTSDPRYLMSGQGMTQAQFVNIAAALVKVPGS
jgi:hypothetical protein